MSDKPEVQEPTEDALESSWREYNANGNAGGWERVAFISGFGKGWRASVAAHAPAPVPPPPTPSQSEVEQQSEEAARKIVEQLEVDEPMAEAGRSYTSQWIAAIIKSVFGAPADSRKSAPPSECPRCHQPRCENAVYTAEYWNLGKWKAFCWFTDKALPGCVCELLARIYKTPAPNLNIQLGDKTDAYDARKDEES